MILLLRLLCITITNANTNLTITIIAIIDTPVQTRAITIDDTELLSHQPQC